MQTKESGIRFYEATAYEHCVEIDGRGGVKHDAETPDTVHWECGARVTRWSRDPLEMQTMSTITTHSELHSHSGYHCGRNE